MPDSKSNIQMKQLNLKLWSNLMKNTHILGTDNGMMAKIEI
jgi:hypothetical protein